MKRILMLVPRMNIGGAETYVYTVAEELHKRGDYEIFCASGGGVLADKLSKSGVKTFFVPIRLSKKLSVFMLKRIIKQYKIDLIHANSGGAGVVAAQLKRETGVKVIYTAHGLFGDGNEYSINCVDKIICVSDYVKQWGLDRHFDEERLITRYSGIDIKKFNPNINKRVELRDKYKISKDTLVLITISRIKNLQHKGHKDLVDMFKKYATNDNWRLVIVGKGNGLPKLKFEIAQAGLNEKIVCLGHRTDVNDLLNMADVYVSPTDFETFGLAIAEGMAMEKPAVVYSIGGTVELMNDGQTGYLARHRDVRDMYDKIKYLDENRDVLKKMSIQARQWVVDNFTNEKMVDEIEDIYLEVLSK